MKYSRLGRKQTPPDIIIKGSGGLTDLFDNVMKEAYIITDDEYDWLLECMEDTSEYDLLFKETLTYKEAKQLLLAINKHLDNQ